MTTDEFEVMVNRHDILYDYADDHSAWKKGFNERIAIDKARKELGDEICVPVWNAKVNRLHEDIREIYKWKTGEEKKE